MQKRWPSQSRVGRGAAAPGGWRCLVAGILTIAIAPAASRAACGDFGLPEGSEIVEFETALGSICLELLREDAPITVQNFVNYVEDGDYDGTVIHRSAPGFVVQGGGFAPAGTVLAPIPTDPPVANEPCIRDTPSGIPGVMICSERGNEPATVAMAKLGGQPNSATSQWFINLADNRTNLDNQNGGFTVFARVLGETFAVAEAIEALPIADQVAGFFLGPASGTAFASVPLLSPVPALASPFGCWDPSAMSLLLTAVLFGNPSTLTIGAASDRETGGTSFLSTNCGEEVTAFPFFPSGPSVSCPSGDMIAAGIAAPFATLANPVATSLPPLTPLPPGFPFDQFFLPGEPAGPGFQLVVFRCDVIAEAFAQRAAWRADLWNRASPELVVIEQASVRVVPEPGAAAGVAVVAALGLLARRRARCC